MQSKDILKNDLFILESKLFDYLKTPNDPTNEILKHIFSSGGKRVRPSLFLLFSHLFCYEGEHKYPIAAVCEYIHTASLLHDDVIDNSTLRRNKPTANSIWGDESAILAGDLIYSAACRLMVKTRSLELIDAFAECIRLMSESELYQLDMMWKQNISQQEYNRIVYGKTAFLFETCASSVGYLCEKDEDTLKLLSAYGKHLGFAFQIIDDCLDYTAQETEVGKPVAADLIEGKITLPLIYGMAKSSDISSLVKDILEAGQASKEQKQTLIHLLEKHQAIQEAKAEAENHIKQAKEALLQIRNRIKHPLSHTQEEAYEHLMRLLNLTIVRKN